VEQRDVVQPLTDAAENLLDFLRGVVLFGVASRDDHTSLLRGYILLQLPHGSPGGASHRVKIQFCPSHLLFVCRNLANRNYRNIQTLLPPYKGARMGPI
jgi:hypothetical protein